MTQPASSPVFVPITALDATLLAQIHGESFGAEGWSAHQMKGSLDLSTTEGWLLRQDQEVIGFILCQRVGEEAEILTFCIRPSAQRQGYGEKLVRFATAQLHKGDAPVEKTYLEVAADNEPARKLYEKCGFYENGLRVNYYQRGNRRVDAIHYVYHL